MEANDTVKVTDKLTITLNGVPVEEQDISENKVAEPQMGTKRTNEVPKNAEQYNSYTKRPHKTDTRIYPSKLAEQAAERKDK